MVLVPAGTAPFLLFVPMQKWEKVKYGWGLNGCVCQRVACNMPMIIARTLHIRRVVRLYGFIFAIKCNQFCEKASSSTAQQGDAKIFILCRLTNTGLHLQTIKQLELFLQLPSVSCRRFNYNCNAIPETEMEGNSVKSISIIVCVSVRECKCASVHVCVHLEYVCSM